MQSLRRLRPYAFAVALSGLAACSVSEYPDDVVAQFAQQCMTQPGATVDRCLCVLDGIEKEYTLQEYTRLVQQVQQGAPLPQNVVKIFQDCSKVDAPATTAPPTQAPSAPPAT